MKHWTELAATGLFSVLFFSSSSCGKNQAWKGGGKEIVPTSGNDISLPNKSALGTPSAKLVNISTLNDLIRRRDQIDQMLADLVSGRTELANRVLEVIQGNNLVSTDERTADEALENIAFFVMSWHRLVQGVACPKEDRERFLKFGTALAQLTDPNGFGALHLISNKHFPRFDVESTSFADNWSKTELYKRVANPERFSNEPPWHND